MPNLSSLVTQLKKECDRVEKQLSGSGLNAELTAFAVVYGVAGRGVCLLLSLFLADPVVAAPL